MKLEDLICSLEKEFQPLTLLLTSESILKFYNLLRLLTPCSPFSFVAVEVDFLPPHLVKPESKNGWVWAYFTKESKEGRTEFVMCNFCHKTLKVVKGGLTSLKFHLRNKHNVQAPQTPSKPEEIIEFTDTSVVTFQD